MLIVNKIISSILEICLFLVIPFIWWFINARKNERFLEWIGLKKIEKEDLKNVIRITVITSIFFTLLSAFIIYIVKDIETATSEFKGLGISALLPALIYALFNTSLPEELLFRGFLLKRFSNKFGFCVANTIQSILFGLIHGIMFFNLLGILKTILIIVATGGIAFVMGYINEKKSNGSIYPSWFIHATANTFSAVISLFNIM